MKLELITETVRKLLDEGLNVDEFNLLVEKASTKEEIEFYTEIYNYLLRKNQCGIIKKLRKAEFQEQEGEMRSVEEFFSEMEHKYEINTKPYDPLSKVNEAKA